MTKADPNLIFPGSDPGFVFPEEGSGSRWQRYRRKQIAELRPYVEGESLYRVSISAADKDAGSPKPGDMIARNAKNHDDQWLVAGQYFRDNFEAVE